MKVTSAAANKKLRQLNDDFAFLCKQDYEKRMYLEVEGVKPVVPQYDFDSTCDKMTKYCEDISKLKHAINVFNTSTVLDGFGITIDQALVTLAFLTKEKERLDRMRNMQPKKLNNGFGASVNKIEYTCANFDIKQAEQAYAEVADKLSRLQLALDVANTTLTFDVGID